MKKLITITLLTACIFTTNANDFNPQPQLQCIDIGSEGSGISSIGSEGSGFSSIGSEGSGISSIGSETSGRQKFCTIIQN